MHGFSIEHPGWQVRDGWAASSTVEFAGPAGSVTVSLQPSYELVGREGKEPVRFDAVGRAQLEAIARSLEFACRANAYGPCWDYSLKESAIATVGGGPAATVWYSAVQDDREEEARVLVAPDSGMLWVVEGRGAPGSGAAEAVLGFDLDGPVPGPAAPREPDAPLSRALKVNLVMIGDGWGGAEAEVSASLPQSRQPEPFFGEPPQLRYDIEYRFFHADGDGLAGFMSENSSSRPLFGSDLPGDPFWQAAWVASEHPEWIEGGRYPEYRLVDAEAVERRIQESVISPEPGLAGRQSVNLVFLNLGPDRVPYLHNYYVSGRDKATDEPVSAVGLMGYGGNYNSYFFDLYAAPWVQVDPSTLEHAVPPEYRTLHDCDSCLAEVVASRARAALEHIVAPSVLYPVESHPSYLLDVLVYVMPGNEVTLNATTLEWFLDQESVIQELQYLYPFADWRMDVSVERRDTRGLSYEFKQRLQEAEHHTIPATRYWKEYSYALLDTASIRPYLTDWAERRVEARGPGSTVIPVLVVVDNWDSAVYLDRLGVLGIAAGKAGDPSSPCCVLGMADQSSVWEDGIGFTDLVLHETGHWLGLMHPFQSLKGGQLQYGNYFDWYASPMTYSFPSVSGCGRTYSLVYEGACGNPSVSFTEFERARLSDARLAWLVASSERMLEGAAGGGAERAREQLDRAVRLFESGDMDSPRGALRTAMQAHEAALALQGGIPGWVRSAAAAWASGESGDAQFIEALRHLAQEGLLEAGERGGLGAVLGQDHGRSVGARPDKRRRVPRRHRVPGRHRGRAPVTNGIKYRPRRGEACPATSRRGLASTPTRPRA